MARTFFNRTNTPTNRAGHQVIHFKLYGQWDEAIKVVNALSPAIKKASLKAQLTICQDIARKVKKHIKNQDLNWQPLSFDYESRKEAAGLSGRTLEAYGNYYNNIKAWQVSNQNYTYVGVKKGVYTRELNGRKSRYDIATIAAIHELSTGPIIPKRPLWNPTIAELGGAPGLKKQFIKHLIVNLRAKGIPVKPFYNIFGK